MDLMLKLLVLFSLNRYWFNIFLTFLKASFFIKLKYIKVFVNRIITLQ